MKGNIYDQFVNSNQLHKFRAAKVHACSTLLEQINQNKITGTEYLISIYSAQQIISYRFNSQMVVKLASSKVNSKKARIAIPKILLDSFRSNSFNISSMSILINYFYDFILILRSFSLAAINLFDLKNSKLNNIIKEKKSEGYTVVILNPSFPKGDIFSEESEFNFINWHSKRSKNKICYIHFDKNFKQGEIRYKNQKVSIIYVAKLKFTNGIANKIKIFKNCVVLVINSGFKIPGKFISVFKIIDQIILSEQIRVTSQNSLPDIIIFSDSYGILKPYWTNTLQEQNVKIQYYFFSSYDSPTVINDEDPRLDFWKLNTWPEIYCVDDYQASFINFHKVSRNQKVQIVGFPDFSDFPIQFANLDSRFKMLVFDYEPTVGHFGYSSINDCGYYTYASNLLFIKLLYELAKELNIEMMHKPKRLYLDNQRDSNYLTYLKSLDSNFYKSIDPRVSPRKIIKISDIVVSKPLTSTAFIAKELSKESVYFDPIGKVSQQDPALRGVPVLNDINRLRQSITILILAKRSNR
jgi:polysaccharide biosynthesis PFTS motif protein